MSKTNAASIAVSEETNLRVSMKTLCAIGMAVSAAVWAWASIKGEVSGHTQQFVEIRSDVKETKNELQSQREQFVRMDAKLDFLVGGRRGTPPMPGSANQPAPNP